MVATLMSLIVVFSASPTFAQVFDVGGNQGRAFNHPDKIFEVCFLFPALYSEDDSSARLG
jgi:hypothetical protein